MATDFSDSFSRRRFLAVAAATAATTACTSGGAKSGVNPSVVTGRYNGTSAKGGVVLFQGDSVTDTGRNRNAAGANNAGALGNGYPLLVTAGVMRDDPFSPWQFFNRGVSGNKIPDLVTRWDADALALKPDVLSLLIGINDYWHTKTLGYKGTTVDFESGLGSLLARTTSALPSVRLVVMEPFVLRIGAVDGTWFPAFDERRAIVARVAANASATFVALQATFDRVAQATGPAHWAADGVHPTPAGHALIAQRWLETVKL